jgi:phosphomannomutase
LLQAQETGAALVLANDPDADRLAVCARDQQGALRRLSGNQVGLLLADYLLRAHSTEPKAKQALLVSSLVSSPMLQILAESYAAKHVSTLTGFKWILAAAAEHEDAAHRFVFGYEEAQGYCFDGLVRDKDGISAALLFADLASSCQHQGLTVVERLFELYRRCGMWVSAQHTFPFDPALGPALLDRLVASSPRRVEGSQVTKTVDYRRGAKLRSSYLGKAELVELQLRGGSRVMVRPSGTEPKLKLYVDHRVDCPEGPLASAEQAAEAEARRMAAEVALVCRALVQ